MRKVVILTAIPIERKAVRAYLPERTTVEHPKSGTIYDHGYFPTTRGRWDVSIVEMGMGDVSAAHIAQEAIDFLAPDLLFFVGVAGGLKDVEPGDVVAATKIYQYESGKAAEHFYPRAEIALSAHRLTQRARVIIADDEWQVHIKGTPLEKAPKARVGAIAAGEKVVSSTASSTWKFLHKNYGDALAIEMEGFGVLAAANANQGVEAIVIRGISDTLNDKNDLDKLGYQEIAARYASAFAFEMLAQMDPQDNEQGEKVSVQTPAVSQPAIPPLQTHTAPNESSPATSSGAVKLFYSYDWSNEIDTRLIKELKANLTVLRRSGKIQEWDIANAGPNTDLADAVKMHLQQDDIFVLGISPSYISSLDYDYYSETEAIMEQRASRNAVVIPVLLRKTDNVGELPIGKLILLPRNQKPVVEDRENALPDIAGEIRKVVQRVLGK